MMQWTYFVILGVCRIVVTFNVAFCGWTFYYVKQVLSYTNGVAKLIWQKDKEQDSVVRYFYKLLPAIFMTMKCQYILDSTQCNLINNSYEMLFIPIGKERMRYTYTVKNLNGIGKIEGTSLRKNEYLSTWSFWF